MPAPRPASEPRLLHGLAAARAAGLGPVVATLGVFDGVHLGHREVLARARAEADRRGLPLWVVTFARHPRAVLLGRAPQSICSLRHRLCLLGEHGADGVLLLRFGQALRAIEAEAFARGVFSETLQADHVVLGYDNRFGRGARGDLNTLLDVGLSAESVPPRTFGEAPVSSTAIREAVLLGELERAERMLGRPFSLLGNVVGGDRLGRTIGFPTANLNLHHAVRPPRGVYGAHVLLRDRGGEPHFGLVNIGIRPTLVKAQDLAKLRLDDWTVRDRIERFEVHLLDFGGDLYGERIEVRFLEAIRPEMRFDGLPSLRAQIERDREHFRARLRDFDDDLQPRS